MHESELNLSFVRGLVDETRILLNDVLAKTTAADLTAKTHKSKWTERHRLQVLVDAAEQTARALPGGVWGPWWLAELCVIRDRVKIWKEDPSWNQIETSLVDAHTFSHMISTLLVAENFKMDGYKVQLVPTTAGATPDLRVQVRGIGGKPDWLLVECYQPAALSGKPIRLSPAEATRTLNKAMAKAKRQLTGQLPCELAICAYNQSPASFETFKQIVVSRLAQSTRSNLAGIILLWVNYLVTSSKKGVSFSILPKLEFVPSPAYFDPVGFEPVTSTEPGSVVEPVTEQTVKDVLLLQRTLGASTSEESRKHSILPDAAPSSQRLRFVKDFPTGKTVLTWVGTGFSGFFRGEGNINCLCGNCSRILGMRMWKLSCGGLFLECPDCKVYNDLPALDLSTLVRMYKIPIPPGRHNCSTQVILKRGACIIGVEKGVLGEVWT